MTSARRSVLLAVAAAALFWADCLETADLCAAAGTIKASKNNDARRILGDMWKAQFTRLRASQRTSVECSFCAGLNNCETGDDRQSGSIRFLEQSIRIG